LHAGWPIDVVYERYSLWSFAGLRFARRYDVPFILEVNAPLAAQQESYRRLSNRATAHAIERLLLGRADRVVVPSKVLAEHVVACGCPPQRVRVIPCGVAPSFFCRGGAETKRRADDEPFVIGFVGSLKPWHGIETLLEAFKR